MAVGEATAADNLPFLAKFFVVADEGGATEAAMTEEVVAAATLTATVGSLATAAAYLRQVNLVVAEPEPAGAAGAMAAAAAQEAASVTVAAAAEAAAAATAVASAESVAALALLAAALLSFLLLLNSLRFAMVDGKLDGFIGVNELTQRI